MRNAHPAPARECLLLFPGALGDFLCFLPTADALRKRLGARITIATHPAYGELVADRPFDLINIDRREVAGLFARERQPLTDDLLGGFARVLSWTGSHDSQFRNNLRAITPGEIETFAFNDFHPGEHAADRFARCAGVTAGRTILALPVEARRWARATAEELRIDSETLIIHPGSGSLGKTWQGMDDLAASWRRHRGKVFALIGPADSELSNCDATIRHHSLAAIAALLDLAPFFLGNDSGISHLAAATSCPGLALFADSDPTIWSPRSENIDVLHANEACEPCGPDRFCTHRLSVDEVLGQVDRLQGESYRRFA